MTPFGLFALSPANAREFALLLWAAALEVDDVVFERDEPLTAIIEEDAGELAW